MRSKNAGKKPVCVCVCVSCACARTRPEVGEYTSALSESLFYFLRRVQRSNVETTRQTTAEAMREVTPATFSTHPILCWNALVCWLHHRSLSDSPLWFSCPIRPEPMGRVSF